MLDFGEWLVPASMKGYPICVFSMQITQTRAATWVLSKRYTQSGLAKTQPYRWLFLGWRLAEGEFMPQGD
jgi:hypothetical protein